MFAFCVQRNVFFYLCRQGFYFSPALLHIFAFHHQLAVLADVAFKGVKTALKAIDPGIGTAVLVVKSHLCGLQVQGIFYVGIILGLVFFYGNLHCKLLPALVSGVKVTADAYGRGSRKCGDFTVHIGKAGTLGSRYPRYVHLDAISPFYQFYVCNVTVFIIGKGSPHPECQKVPLYAFRYGAFVNRLYIFFAVNFHSLAGGPHMGVYPLYLQPVLLINQVRKTLGKPAVPFQVLAVQTLFPVKSPAGAETAYLTVVCRKPRQIFKNFVHIPFISGICQTPQRLCL